MLVMYLCCVLTFENTWQTEYQTKIERVYEVRRKIAVFVCTCVSKGTGERQFVYKRETPPNGSKQSGG